MDQTVTEELKQDIKKQDQEKVKQEDFKMVTFTLANLPMSPILHLM
jgi:hypothetical protein